MLSVDFGLRGLVIFMSLGNAWYAKGDETNVGACRELECAKDLVGLASGAEVRFNRFGAGAVVD